MAKGTIKVNHEAIEFAAQKLAGEKASFESISARFDESFAALSGAWQGTAATNFTGTAALVEKNFDGAIDNIWLFSRKIGLASAQFKKVDSAIASNINQGK